MSDTVRISNWQNGTVNLWHGTDEASAKLIQAKGVDLNFIPQSKNHGWDFGRGFYTTSNPRQAWAAAEKQSKLRSRKARTQLDPVVILFETEIRRLSGLTSISFVNPSSYKSFYWSFVRSLRRGGLPHVPALQLTFDVVVGPVAKNWTAETHIAEWDQTSFHTDAACGILNGIKTRAWIKANGSEQVLW
jgi:hypothetical protein